MALAIERAGSDRLSVGDAAPAISGAQGTDGKTYSMDSFKDKDVVVVVFTCNSCPVAASYEDRVVAFANYPVDAIPESARLLYLVGLLDVAQHLLSRIWLVPSADFNRLAYREHSARPGRVTLQFSCLASGDASWDQFEVPRLELGSLLEPLVAALGPATVEELGTLRGQVST